MDHRGFIVSLGKYCFQRSNSNESDLAFTNGYAMGTILLTIACLRCP